MEAEGEGKDEAKEVAPDPKPGVNKIVVSLGSKQLGSAPKGQYDRATKQLTIAAMTWKTGVDPTELLQKKISLAGVYEDSAEGSFANDMKLFVLSTDRKKATFKGA